MVTIRPAQARDLDALVALEEDCEGMDAWSRSLIADGLAGTLPAVHYLVTDDVEGYVVVSCVDDIAELQRIGVAAERRRSGLGSLLLDEAFRVARREGTQRMLLEVREDNRPALALYAGKGFVEIDRRPRYYRDGATAIVMRLPVMKGCGGG